LRGSAGCSPWRSGRSDGEAASHPDPLGMKPLYYTALPARQGLRSLGDKSIPGDSRFQPKMNRSALQQFLEFGYTFDSGEHLLRGSGSCRRALSRKSPPGFRDRRLISPLRPPLKLTPQPAGTGGRVYAVLSEVVAHTWSRCPCRPAPSGGSDPSVGCGAGRPHAGSPPSDGLCRSAVDERPMHVGERPYRSSTGR